ncbi:MAG: AAA family ATPase [Epsilonproteobacteria bacterium]|nr:AAA family ATPase [Campylobacterota bacterium]
MKKIPIGKSDFKSIIDNNFYYIDKSELITEVINSNADIILLPRPRRFGKTLNLSMLNYFFSIEEGEENLFKDLNIYNNREIMNHCSKYPIIYITFKDVKENSFEQTLESIKFLIDKEFSKHQKKIDTILNIIEIADKKHYQRIINQEASEVDYKKAFKLLSKLLTLTYNQKCIVLIDDILLHKKDKNRLAIVMELKTIDEFEEETKEKKYISLVKKRGYNNILAFGVVFDGKRVWVREV